MKQKNKEKKTCSDIYEIKLKYNEFLFPLIKKERCVTRKSQTAHAPSKKKKNLKLIRIKSYYLYFYIYFHKPRNFLNVLYELQQAYLFRTVLYNR